MTTRACANVGWTKVDINKKPTKSKGVSPIENLNELNWFPENAIILKVGLHICKKLGEITWMKNTQTTT
jgi:hypothetical protein